jgi:DNA-binding response OmpR family regulator
MAMDLFRASRKEIRLVLLDLTMPKMDGRETFQAIRNLDDRVPILIMSGYSEQEVRGPSTGSRLDGFIQKPFTRATLGAKLAELLGD